MDSWYCDTRRSAITKTGIILSHVLPSLGQQLSLSAFIQQQNKQLKDHSFIKYIKLLIIVTIV